MNKKFKSILACSLLTVSLVGCQETLTSSDIQDSNPSFNQHQIQQNQEQNQEQNSDYEQRLINSIKNATYGMQNDKGETVYDLSFDEIFRHHYVYYEWKIVNIIDDNNFTVAALAQDGRYVILGTDDTNVIKAKEVCEERATYKGSQAEDIFYHEYVLTAYEPIKAELEKGEQQQKKQNNNYNKKSKAVEGTCIYCDGPLEDDDKKSVCKSCLNDPMAATGGKHWVELDYKCAQCGKQMVNVYLDGTHKDDFCSISCEDAWYKEYARTNQTAYCEYCGGETTVASVEQWDGCCSEFCAVQREGDAYEEMERNGLIGGETDDTPVYAPYGHCPTCDVALKQGETYCSQECENYANGMYD